MRKIIMFITAAVLAVTAVAFAPPAQASTSEYVRWIHSKVYGSKYLTRTQIVNMGKLICTSLDKGVDIYEIGEIAMDDGGYTTDEAAAWVVGAVYFVCPRNKWMLG